LAALALSNPVILSLLLLATLGATARDISLKLDQWLEVERGETK
jgi:hypothetical protein